MAIDIDNVQRETASRMAGAIDAMKRDFAAVRTGKASPAMVDGLTVDYYGTQTRLKDMASVTAPEPRLLMIQPWDQGAVKGIEKAIIASDLGISPVSDGRVIRLPIPELSEERRKEFVKQVHSRSEDGRIEVRSARRTANDIIKKAQKASDITEDDLKVMMGDIQKITDKQITAINDLLESKEKELMSI